MAHELDTKANGQAAMAFIGEKPWHGLGQELTEDATLETWKVEAGLDWKAVATPVIYQANGKTFRQNSKKVLFRDDTSAPLSIVSDKFKIVQPVEVLEFFRDLMDGAGFKMETAGCLFGGRKIWVLAKTGKSAMIGGVDEIKPYLLAGTSLDGSMSTVFHFTSTRVVCNNTLRMAIGANKGSQIKVPHNSILDSQGIKEQLGLANEIFDTFIEEVEAISSIRLDREEAITIVANEIKKDWLDADGNSMLPAQMLASSKELSSIINLYDGQGIGSNLKTTKNTGWGLVNAVTQYYDHEARSAGSDYSKVVDRAQFGDRATIKTRIADKIIELA